MNDNYLKSEQFFEPNTELLLRTVNATFSYRGLNRLFVYRSNNQSHNSDVILNKCSVNVPKGKIYSLLGSSGCGKTTLLKCLLGIETLVSGSVKIFQRKNDCNIIKGSNVGYMPQELALLEELTVEQTLTYFGRLHKMEKHLIEEQIEFLLEFLQIPDKRRLISLLSGGQQRRVSLASAIIHYPPLLILDEPTVGVDPLLRHSIWQYLTDLCETKNITIIITTHYIEEARNSHYMGLMRNGSLLVEGRPELIIAYFGCNCMEDVFLKLCATTSTTESTKAYHKQKSINESESELKIVCNQSMNNKRNISNSYENQYSFVFNESIVEKGFLLHESSLDFSRFWPLFVKNWHLIRGNPRSLLFLYLLPSISVSLFALSFGAEPKNILISIFNEENPSYLSAIFIQNLNESKNIKPISFESYESAVDQLIRGHSWAMLYLPQNYSTKLQQRIAENIHSANDLIEDSNIVIQLDNTSPIISYTIITSILESLTKMLTKEFSNGQTLLQSILPLDLKEITYGSPDSIQMTEYFAPGILMATIFIAPWPFVLFSITKEKKVKFLARSLISGANSLEVLTSNLSLQLLILFTQVSVLMVTTFYVWNIPNMGSILLTASILYLIGVIGILFAIIITYVCDSEGEAFMISFSIIIPLWLVCGILWPNESLSTVGQRLSHLAPLTYPIDALRCILSKGWGIDSFPVLMAFICSFVYIVMFSMIALFIYIKQISVY